MRLISSGVITSTPEPSTAILLGSGLIAVLFATNYRRRRQGSGEPSQGRIYQIGSGGLSLFASVPEVDLPLQLLRGPEASRNSRARQARARLFRPDEAQVAKAGDVDLDPKRRSADLRLSIRSRNLNAVPQVCVFSIERSNTLPVLRRGYIQKAVLATAIFILVATVLCLHQKSLDRVRESKFKSALQSKRAAIDKYTTYGKTPSPPGDLVQGGYLRKVPTARPSGSTW